MSDSQGELLLAPAAADGVEIAAADATGLDLDVDVVVAKGFGVKLILVKLVPCLGPIDLEARELVGIRHGGGKEGDGIANMGGIEREELNEGEVRKLELTMAMGQRAFISPPSSREEAEWGCIVSLRSSDMLCRRPE